MAVGLTSGSSASASGTRSAVAAGHTFIFSGENDFLNVYDAATGAKRNIDKAYDADHKHGIDINGQICFVPDSAPWKKRGQIWFIAGEDTLQNTKRGVIRQGWGIFRLTGRTLATFAIHEVGKLIPDSYVTQSDNPENYGCGVLPDGRVITTDVGDELPTAPATGQLIEFFPKARHMTGHLRSGRFDFKRVPSCKIDVGIGTAGGALVEGSSVLVASNRPNLARLELGGIYRYDTKRWPSGPSKAKGCGRKDATGSRLANADRVGKKLFIPQGPLSLTPSHIISNGHGGYFVSSVYSGSVAEYSHNGLFRRNVLTTTSQLGGITPYGIGLTPDGSLWIADIGIVGTGPAKDAGSIVKLPFSASGNPGGAVTIDDNLQFPDGIGVLTIRSR
jgi:hypothetical protein